MVRPFQNKRGLKSVSFLYLPKIISMIVVTGAAGFIGSCLISRLNQDGFNAIVAVDEFESADKNKNLEGKRILQKINRNSFFDWLKENQRHVEFIFHLGARTDTTEFDRVLLWQLNTEYSRELFLLCTEFQIPLVYASSAATYGLGEAGYADDESKLELLKPLNPYGESKNEFDKWAIAQKKKPFFWAGLKFFNVYGPNEYHKGRMASVVFHAFNQIQQSGKMKLFQSHNPEYKDGEQKRDFVYVRDVADVCIFLMHHRKNSGIYNLGSGEARTFKDLVVAVFQSLNKEPQIEFIPTPEDIRDKYQYFTEAKMDKLREIGFKKSFTSLEDGVKEYVSFLQEVKYI